MTRQNARMDARYLGEIELGWHVTAKKIADALEVPVATLVNEL